MNCDILKMIYIRANTEIPCNCDTGEKVNLGWVGERDDWSIGQFFNNERYRHIEESFRRNELPWGEACAHCVFLHPNEPVYNGFAEKRLDRITLEPSLACALRCPGCTRMAQAKVRKGPMFLPPEVWRRVLASLRRDGFSLGYFFICGQGEPLSHPRFEEFIIACREFFPGTPIVLVTNGNYEFADVFKGGHLPDKLIVSVDGLHQASYEQYRVNGDVEQALRFMQDAKRVRERTPMVEWKYILFTYNDSDAELIAAQERAAAMGVDTLQFVLTHTPEKSRRFTPENIEGLPIVWPLAYPETTPNLYFKRPEAKALTPVNSGLVPTFAGAGKVQLSIDDCRYWSGRLFLRGWAMGMDGSSPTALRLICNGTEAGRAQLGIRRDDVQAAFPQVNNRNAGFLISCPLPKFDSWSKASLTLHYDAPGGVSYPFPVNYDLSQTGAEKFNHEC